MGFNSAFKGLIYRIFDRYEFSAKPLQLKVTFFFV